MTKFIESSKYLTLLAIFSLLIAALGGFVWGTLTTYTTLKLIATSGGTDPLITVALIEIMDAFLIATGLLVFSVSLYELAIGPLNLPDWMLAHTLHELKAKLSSIIVLVMAVKFVQKLIEVKSYQDLLYYALAISVVSATLIAFSYFGKKD